MNNIINEICIKNNNQNCIIIYIKIIIDNGNRAIIENYYIFISYNNITYGFSDNPPLINLFLWITF
jgi:hypothetical protein